MKAILQISLLLAFIMTFDFSANSRPMAHWPYEKLTAEADLIVIATPISVKDTGRKTELPEGFRRTGEDNVRRPIPAIEMEATFEVLSVLKGEESNETFIFHYLREESPPKEPFANGAGLVSFDPREKNRYLLFLKREATGGYSSLTGQIDPDHGMMQLGTYP